MALNDPRPNHILQSVGVAILDNISKTADRQPPTADRRLPTADRRPPTAGLPLWTATMFDRPLIYLPIYLPLAHGGGPAVTAVVRSR